MISTYKLQENLISFNCNIQKQNVKRKSRKARCKKVWMSNDCLLLRKEVHSLGNRLAKETNNNALWLTFCNCRREFNKLKNKLKKGFFESLIQQINDVDPKNTKVFWNNINKYKKKNNTCDSSISSKQLQNHYTKLLVNEEDDDSKIVHGKIEESDISQNEDYILDAPFTCKEIKDGIKMLIKRKSGGPDLIVNEFLKAGILTKLFNEILNSGKFPKIWKLSLLTSIFKAEDSSDWKLQRY